ncbi:MAG: L,D-transpeptidase family protein [Chloroflexi bacterium]|nr:L,D-transpeptidase family protein [Chloroflexota bacterium]
MEWAARRLLDDTSKDGVSPEKQDQARVSSDAETNVPGKIVSEKNPKKRNLLPILLIVMGCAVFLFAAWWSALNSPVLASIINMAAPKPTQPVMHLQSFAQVDIAKPVMVNAPVISQPAVQAGTPTATLIPAPTATSQAEATATHAIEAVVVPADPQGSDAVVVPSSTAVAPVATQPEETGVPGGVSAEIVMDTPTSEYAAPTAEAYVPPSTTGSGHWIDVDLSQQRVYAYDGDTVVNSFVVSTGTWQTPTVTGQYHVWIKLLSTPMSGPGYYLPGVPYTMYFYKGYALHGTYWHNNFGTPMSHGCVNLSIPDAEWLYNFSSVGTLVNVHY